MNINEGTKKAIVISVSDYDVLQPLEFCKNDGYDMYDLLKSLNYEIQVHHKLIGRVKWIELRSAIIDFFRNTNVKPSDTLLFYYSGHGVLDDGDHYLAPSETDPFVPDRNGFLFEELTRLMNKCHSRKVVTILDCCYSGAARLGKGNADDTANLGREAIDGVSNMLERGEGKCILAASQSYQKAFETAEQDHSLFTYYLLEGLKGKQLAAVDNNGYVTPDSLSRYVYDTIMSLPPAKRPMQKPIRKVEESGDIVLAYYPELRRDTRKDLSSTPRDEIRHPINKGLKKYLLTGRNKYLLLIPIVVAVIVGIIAFMPELIDLQKYYSGLNYGSQAAAVDIRGGQLFNPACDPTGIYTSGGQHFTSYCNGWTQGYISAWNTHNPGWTQGYISAWKHNGPPSNKTVLACQQCASKQTPYQRYHSGTSDGRAAALLDAQHGQLFNPACDPADAITNDRQHTTEYCNGWNDGYISAWNIQHPVSSRKQND